MSSTTSPSSTRSLGQWLALVIGVVYLLVGVAGFLVTGFDGFASPEGESLLGFEVNPLHNIVHLAIGALGVAMWSNRANARMFGWILLLGYGAATIYGFVVAGSDGAENFLAINQADNFLHLASALAGGVVIATAQPGRDTARAPRSEPAPGRP